MTHNPNHPSDILQDALNTQRTAGGFFTAKPANHWLEIAQQQGECRQLFGEFWHENELSILFGDTGAGKSILAYQIADSISKSTATGIAALHVPAQHVLYVDCELSEKQMEARYSDNGTHHYRFSPNFIRAGINPDFVPPIGIDYDTYLVTDLEKKIEDTGATVVIVDNISYLKNETEKAKDALALMKHLKNLKNKYGLSILVLAHTPKRDLTKPITRNDLAGSKALINFCDSAFTIGESSQDKNLRYLKQIKARNTEIVYDTGNVCLCSINKNKANFLAFTFVQFTTEHEHLKEWKKSDREELIAQAKEFRRKGFTEREIAAKLNISNGAVHKYLKMD